MCGILPGPILLHCWGGEGQCLDLNSWCEPLSGDHCVLGKCEVGPKGRGGGVRITHWPYKFNTPNMAPFDHRHDGLVYSR